MRYEIHVDSQPSPTGGWDREFFIEVNFDDKPQWTHLAPGHVEKVTFAEEE